MTAPIRENTCKSETPCSLVQKLIVHLDGLKPASFKKWDKHEFKGGLELYMWSCM